MCWPRLCARGYNPFFFPNKSFLVMTHLVNIFSRQTARTTSQPHCTVSEIKPKRRPRQDFFVPPKCLPLRSSTSLPCSDDAQLTLYSVQTCAHAPFPPPSDDMLLGGGAVAHLCLHPQQPPGQRGLFSKQCVGLNS